jgi:hypothetical protein
MVLLSVLQWMVWLSVWHLVQVSVLEWVRVWAPVLAKASVMLCTHRPQQHMSESSHSDLDNSLH